MSEANWDVIGIGNAIVDVLAHTEESFLDAYGMAKGSMTLIDAERAQALFDRMGPSIKCSGGSAANTMVGLASFGGNAAYTGKVRDDALGQLFRQDIRLAGVNFSTAAASEGPGTGRCLILVTPDAERTMETFLGISAELTPDDLDPRTIADAKITYLEGYLFDPPPAKRAFLEAARIAHQAGRKVALSLSDAFCVDRHRAEFRELVAEHVDILFANEAEILSLFQVSAFDDAVGSLSGRCKLAALTRGAAGSTIVEGDRVIQVAAEPIERPVDTTGAGDLYAAGFLFGLTQGRDLESCGHLGSLAAAEIISHFGARPETSLADRATRAEPFRT